MPQSPTVRLITEAKLPELVLDILSTSLESGDAITLNYDDTAGIITISGISASDTAENVRDTMAAALVAGAGISISHNDIANSITIAATGGGALDTEVIQDTVAAMILEGSGLAAVYDDAAGTYTITNTVVDTNTTDPEVVRDTVAAMLVSGAGIDIVTNDAADQTTISAEAPEWVPFMPTAFGTNWIDNGGWEYKLLNGMVVLRGEAIRQNSTLTAQTDGSVTTSAVIDVGGLPVEITPTLSWMLSDGRLPSDGCIARCEIRETGQIVLLDAGSGVAIDVGNILVVQGMYPL